jgi:signal transduction histidine kinase
MSPYSIISAVIHNLQSINHLPSNRIIVTYNMHEEMPIDNIAMKVVVHNIIKNALEACPAEDMPYGYIHINVRKNDGKCLIEIKDHGIGISPTDMQNLFKPHWTKGKEGGHGFGLAFSKYVVEAHAGSIYASSCPGAGTTFCIYLPMS